MIVGLGIGVIIVVVLFAIIIPALPHYTWDPEHEQAFEISEYYAEVPVNRTQVDFRVHDMERAIVNLSIHHQGKDMNMIFVVPGDWERTTRIIQGEYTAVVEAHNYTVMVNFSINETFSQIDIYPDRIEQYSHYLEEVETDGGISWRQVWAWRRTLWVEG